MGTDAVFHGREGLGNETYDVRCPDNGDVAFFVELARETGGPILELGCGTGRIAWPLAAEGHDVVGLDLSEPMLRRARAKGPRGPRFLQGDMAAFDLPERFSLIYSGFRSFQMLLTPEAQRACLEGARRHLAPGGRLVLTLFDPKLEYCLDGEVEPSAGVEEVPSADTGRTVRVEVLSRRNDTFRQVLTETWRFTELGEDRRPLRREEEVLEMRWTYRHEMRHLLELAGFEVEAEYSDYTRSPPVYAKEQIWVTRTSS